jgi:hypothetical protein
MELRPLELAEDPGLTDNHLQAVIGCDGAAELAIAHGAAAHIEIADLRLAMQSPPPVSIGTATPA